MAVKPVTFVGLTARAAAPKEQLVAPFGAVQPVPVMLDVPAPTPFTVETETVALEVSEETNIPPLQLPDGGEADVFCPTVTEGAPKATEPAGQEAAEVTVKLKVVQLLPSFDSATLPPLSAQTLNDLFPAVAIHALDQVSVSFPPADKFPVDLSGEIVNSYVPLLSVSMLSRVWETDPAEAPPVLFTRR